MHFPGSPTYPIVVAKTPFENYCSRYVGLARKKSALVILA